MVQMQRRLQHLQVAPRQELARLRHEHRVARKLHAVLGSAESRGADALAGGQQPPGQAPRLQSLLKGETQTAPEVAEVARLALVEVFADAAGEHHAVDVREAR